MDQGNISFADAVGLLPIAKLSEKEWELFKKRYIEFHEEATDLLLKKLKKMQDI